jgi:transposase-like protein
LLAEAARPCRHAVGDRWQVDETYTNVAGRWRYVYRAIDQFGQVVDVFVSVQRDTRAARCFFERAIGTTKVMPVEIVTEPAPVYPTVLEQLLPATWHRTEQYANNRLECDHGRLRRGCARCADSSRIAAPRSRSQGTPWCRTYDADTTNWRSRSR